MQVFPFIAQMLFPILVDSLSKFAHEARQSTKRRLARAKQARNVHQGELVPSYWLFPAAFSHPLTRTFGNCPFNPCPGRKIMSREAFAPSSGVKSAISPPPSSVFIHWTKPMMSVCRVVVRRRGKGTYAWAECHESKSFLFEIESVLDGQGVHGCFGNFVGWGGQVMNTAS